MAQKNSQEIKEIKESRLTSGLEELDKYYKSNGLEAKRDALNNARDNFRKAKLNPVNDALKNLATYYLMITQYESAEVYPNEAKPLYEVEKNCKELAKNASVNSKYLPLVNSAYVAIGDTEGKNLSVCKKALQNAIAVGVKRKIEEKKFDDAEEIVEEYGQSAGNNRLYMELTSKVNNAKKENFEKYKKFTSVSQAMDTIEENQNSLLNEAAVKYLYEQDNLLDAKDLLRNKNYTNEEFRIKAFAAIYSYLGKEEKLKKLVGLVLDNPTYSEKLKKEIREKYQIGAKL
jgi:hypothetical protein